MAPTICSDKKQQQHARPHRHHEQHHQQHHQQQQQQQHQQQQQQQQHQHQQLRIRDLRRRRHGVTMRHIITKSTNVNLSNQLHHQQHQILITTAASNNNGATSTSAATAAAVSTTTASISSLSSSSSSSSSSMSSFSSMSSNVVSFAIKGAMNSSMSSLSASPSSLLPTSSSSVPFRLRLRGRRAELLRAQISDNAVSSSTHLEDEDSNHILPQRTVFESTMESRNDSDSDIDCEFSTDSTGGDGDSETTMDMDSDVENIHAVMVGGMGLGMYRLRHQLSETVLKAKETKPHQLPLAKLSANNKDGHYQSSSANCNTEGLLGIALKTIKLVQRNQLLQKRLAQLQVETSEFIASVLANPENQHFREKITENKDSKTSKQYTSNNGNTSSMLVKNLKH